MTQPKRTTRAWQARSYGPAHQLQLVLRELPVLGPRQVRLRVHASAVNPRDWRVSEGDPYLVRLASRVRQPRRPLIPGADVAGVVEAVGAEVTDLRVGDAVVGDVAVGAFTDDAAGLAEHLARFPEGLTPEVAVAAPLAGVTALQARRDGRTLRPVVGHTFDFEDVPAAIAHVRRGHARGKVGVIHGPALADVRAREVGGQANPSGGAA